MYSLTYSSVIQASFFILFSLFFPLNQIDFQHSYSFSFRHQVEYYSLPALKVERKSLHVVLLSWAAEADGCRLNQITLLLMRLRYYYYAQQDVLLIQGDIWMCSSVFSWDILTSEVNEVNLPSLLVFLFIFCHLLLSPFLSFHLSLRWAATLSSGLYLDPQRSLPLTLLHSPHGYWFYCSSVTLGPTAEILRILFLSRLMFPGLHSCLVQCQHITESPP